MQVDHGKRIAELYDDIEEAEVMLKRATAASSMIQEELGDL